MSVEELNRDMELEEVVVTSDGTSETKNTIDPDNIRILKPFRRVKFERRMLIGIFIIVLIILFLLIIICILLFNNQNSKIENGSSKKCFTVNCLQVGANILKSIDTSLDPCLDFEKFACGKWKKSSVLPPGTVRYSVFEMIKEKLIKIQRSILEKINDSTSTVSETKMVKFYKSCIDTRTINERGVKPFTDMIGRLFNRYGGWEMLPDNKNFSINKWNFKEVVENVIFDLPFVLFHVNDDFKDNKTKQLYLYPGILLLEQVMLLSKDKDDIRKEYKKFMIKALKLFGVKKFLTDEIFELAVQVGKVSPNASDMHDVVNTYNPITLDNLNNDICPIFNWTRILELRKMLNTTKYPIKIIATAPVYLKNVCAIMRNYMENEHKKRILHNFLIWRLLDLKVDLLSDEIQNTKTDLIRLKIGVVGKNPRWKDCISMTNKYMSTVMGKLFIQNYFNMQSKPQVIEMINLLKKQYIENLKENEWMDLETRKNAILKMAEMKPIIGYTDDVVDSVKTDEYYKNIVVDEKKFFENVAFIYEHDELYLYSEVGHPRNKTSIKNPLDVNAFYDSARNQILFPAAILSPPYFDPGVPRGLNLAGVGSVISHEMTHGLDDTGSQFDAFGIMRNWWSDQTRRRFIDKASCIVKQYNRYKISNENINGNFTLGENIADNGGTRLAFQVYQKLQQQYGKDDLLPGIPYTHDQLFFISYARLWCSIETKGYLQFNIRNDPHSPNKYRIIGVLSNMKEFANAFKCPLGSPMNPSEKCRVW